MFTAQEAYILVKNNDGRKVNNPVIIPEAFEDDPESILRRALCININKGYLHINLEHLTQDLATLNRMKRILEFNGYKECNDVKSGNIWHWMYM